MKNKDILSETNNLFDIAADKLSLDKDLIHVLKAPYREVKVELPVKDLNGAFCLYHGYRVQHNGARGPYYGAISLETDIDRQAVIDMASRTTWKTALMDIPFGGAYGAINIDGLAANTSGLNASVRGYTRKISSLIGPYKDIIAQSKTADANIMASVMDEYGKKYGYSPAVACGKPIALGGSVGRNTALVSSSYYILDLVAKNMQIQLQGLPMALSILSNQAVSFIDYLNYLGCKLVAISDDIGAVYDNDGLNLDDLREYIVHNKKIYDYPNANKITLEEFISFDCDVMLLGNDSTIVTKDNAINVKAKILAEVSDALISIDADPILFDKGAVVVPDMLITSGETIVDYFEWIQNIQQFKWDYDQINEEMAKTLNETFKLVNNITIDHEVSYRIACYIAGIQRVSQATLLRGYM